MHKLSLCLMYHLLIYPNSSLEYPHCSKQIDAGSNLSLDHHGYSRPC